MKKLSVKTVVAIGIGAALFFVLGKVSIPTPVPNTYISLQYAVQAVFAALFGPIAGLLIGVVTMKLDINEGIDTRKIVHFNVAQVIAHLLSWGLVAPCLDILIYSEPIEKLFAQGLMAGISNMVTTGIVGSLLLVAYAKTVVRKGSLSKED